MDLQGTLSRDTDPTPIPIALGLEGDCLVVRGPAAQRMEWPLDSLELTAGGFEGDFVFCRSPATPGTTVTVHAPAFVEALAATSEPSLLPKLEPLRRHAARARRGSWISLGVGLALLVAVIVAVVLAPSAIASTVVLLPTSLDRQLGDAAWDPQQLGGPERSDPAIVAPVQELVDRLASGAPSHTLRVSVIESEQVNALALPGGRIAVFTGLLRQAESPDQVAGVLAHEVAHVERRHGMRNLAHRAGLGLLLPMLIGGDSSAWVALAAEGAALALQSGYSREQESQADADAVTTMARAGLDPAALAQFFRRMEEQGEGSGALVSWLSTHPEHEVRATAVEALARNTPRASAPPLEADWAALRTALAR